MANTHLDDTPQDGDLSMSFTCRPPELPGAYRVSYMLIVLIHYQGYILQTPTFMDLSNITRDQSFTSTPIIVSV